MSLKLKCYQNWNVTKHDNVLKNQNLNSRNRHRIPCSCSQKLSHRSYKLLKYRWFQWILLEIWNILQLDFFCPWNYISTLCAEQSLHGSIPCAEQSMYCSHPCAEQTLQVYSAHGWGQCRLCSAHRREPCRLCSAHVVET